MTASTRSRVRIRAVAFDLGDTLLETRDFAEMERVAQNLGVTGDAEAFAHAYRSVDAEFDQGASVPEFGQFWRRVLDDVNRSPVPSATVDRFLAGVGRSFSPKSVYSDTRQCLEELSEEGRILAVITNGDSEERSRTILDNSGILPFFRFVVAAGSVGVAKPDPAIFHRALDRIGVSPSEAVYVGNLPNVDARAAIRAGLHGVWLHRDGTGFGDGPPQITSLAELPGWIRELERGR